MYDLPYFKAENEQQVIDFMKERPFVLLTGCSGSLEVVATHIPLLVKQRDGKIFLQGHIMRNTDHHRAFAENPKVLAVFSGPHAYVSASWYTDKKQASTWNYMTVHAKGMLQFGDEQMLMEVLDETTSLFENDETSPSLFAHLPVEYVQRLSKAIIAFEIEVSDLQHVFKLSQNRDDESYRNIVEQLSARGVASQQLAEEMKKNRCVKT